MSRQHYGGDKLPPLGFDNTDVTDEGVEKVQRVLPNCKIAH